MGKARSATDALEAEIERLEREQTRAVSEAQGWMEKAQHAAGMAEQSQVKVGQIGQELAARRTALELLSGKQTVGGPTAAAVEKAVQSAVEETANGEMSEETKALLAAAHDGEDEDEDDPKPTPQARKRKAEDDPDIRTLRPGENPADMLERLRAEEEGTPVAG